MFAMFWLAQALFLSIFVFLSIFGENSYDMNRLSEFKPSGGIVGDVDVNSYLYVLNIIVSLVICADCCRTEFYKGSIDTASSWSMPIHCMPVTHLCTFLRLCQLPSGKEAHSRRFS